jgi:hypothetical protein
MIAFAQDRWRFLVGEPPTLVVPRERACTWRGLAMALATLACVAVLVAATGSGEPTRSVRDRSRDFMANTLASSAAAALARELPRGSSRATVVARLAAARARCRRETPAADAEHLTCLGQLVVRQGVMSRMVFSLQLRGGTLSMVRACPARFVAVPSAVAAAVQRTADVCARSPTSVAPVCDLAEVARWTSACASVAIGLATVPAIATGPVVDAAPVAQPVLRLVW